ncbi:exosome complex component rrp4 [Anaeramoeba ignava]|uniref:Exosome complex component rrp4 n=1 Tax=Anaeramoeba ignava TaxID=1746090 RepID=A0A9Q0RC20_ANAIG|nr:exosome complex component rrp4 [Anaeramoeba ignava]
MINEPQRIVTPGEILTQESDFLRGHGVSLQNNQLTATISGVVEKVNKLVSVEPLKSRYNPHVGDIVIGRINEVMRKKWKVEVNSTQNAILSLSAIILPDGIQRRRTSTDEMNMRNFYKEDDLICAEVQKIQWQENKIFLHTRSLKYGKLKIRSIDYLLLILGVNGYCWISSPETVPKIDKKNTDKNNWWVSTHQKTDFEKDLSTDPKSAKLRIRKRFIDDESQRYKSFTQEMREKIARTRNSIFVLSTLNMTIDPIAIMKIYSKSLSLQLESKDMLEPNNMMNLIDAKEEEKI